MSSSSSPPDLPGKRAFDDSSLGPAQSHPAAGTAPIPRRSAWITFLLGLVIFLVLLILVVFAARRLRPMARPLLSRGSAATLAPLVDRLQNAPTREDRAAAAGEIVKLGPDAVVSALDGATAVSLSDNIVRIPRPLVQAFADVGPPAVPLLLKCLATDQENVRTAAVDVLREMGPAAETATGELARLLNDKNGYVRALACDSLGNLGLKAAPAVGALTAAVDHEDAYTRRRAIVALGRIGPPAKAAAGVLRRARQQGSTEDIRDAAAVALLQIDLEAMVTEAAGKANPEVRELIRRLREKDESEAVAAARNLARRGAEARAAVPALAAALANRSKAVRTAAAEALGALGPAAKSVVPALQRAAEAKEPEVRDAAQKALNKIGV